MNKIFFIIYTAGILFYQDFYAQQNNLIVTKIVKIGLLINDGQSVAARNAAEMAIYRANKEENTNGLQFQLIVRTMEGPWGVGSKQAVNLIFKENVWAILGSHDGRNAHLVEQVIAKMHTVFLSAWASDSTLSQAFVPWYFSCVPNDNQQADALIERIYKKGNNPKIATILDNGYDSKQALNSFLKKVKMTGKNNPMQLFYENSNTNIDDIISQIQKSNINTVILFVQPSYAVKIIRKIQQLKMNQTIYGTLSLLEKNENSDFNFQDYENIIITNNGNWWNSSDSLFKNEYQKRYGKSPSAVAAYAFDGVNVIIKAIKNSGFNREKLKKAMSNIRFKGVTGLIQFDQNGNRSGNVGFVKIIKGMPIKLKE